MPENVSHFSANAIVLPENLWEEINQCVDELSGITRRKKIDEIASDIRYRYHMYHMYQMRWITKQFWNMMKTDTYHPRKIDALINWHNLPFDWLPSSAKVSFDKGLWPFTTMYNDYMLMEEDKPDFR